MPCPDIFYAIRTMKANSHPRRYSLRLTNYDYTKIGAYFVTICTKDRKNVFGKIEDGLMVLNPPGEIVRQEWLQFANVRHNVKLDEFMVMPNHFHAILFITDQGEGMASHAPTKKAPTKRIFGHPVSGSLSTIIGGFKSGTSKRINQLANFPYELLWQRSFFEHVIRTDASLARIREYIVTNPLRWDLDRENPQRQGMDDFDQWLDQL